MSVYPWPVAMALANRTYQASSAKRPQTVSSRRAYVAVKRPNSTAQAAIWRLLGRVMPCTARADAAAAPLVHCAGALSGSVPRRRPHRHAARGRRDSSRKGGGLVDAAGRWLGPAKGE